jgi:serine/threonine-protein kinase HipA
MSSNPRKQLEVRVSNTAVGVLEQTGSLQHVFSYLPEIPNSHFVSLTMPVRAESYVWERGLHPCFQMNLPEGYRKDLLRQRVGPVATVDDFSLLALTGSSTIGRVTVHSVRRDEQESKTPHGSVADILSRPDSRSALLEYLDQTPLDAVAGVMPKALAADERLTLRTPEWIVKTGRDDTPGICVNEYICLELARRIGLPTPTADLAQDGEVLAIARFDLSEEKQSLGLEDLCSLLGLAPHQKYDATAEQLARAMLAFVSNSEKLDSSRRLLDMLILNAAIRNADGHAKNFALLYSDIEHVTLAPVYDLLTVHAYTAYAKNPYAILVGGTKGWNLRKPLEKFALERLSLRPSQVGDTIERIASEMTAMAARFTEMADRFPQFREPAKAMVRAWTEGVTSLSDKAKPVRVDLSAVKFSEEKRPQKKRASTKIMNPEPLE